jgi:hypothetical protein
MEGRGGMQVGSVGGMQSFSTLNQVVHIEPLVFKRLIKRDIIAISFLTLALDGGKWSASRSAV